MKRAAIRIWWALLIGVALSSCGRVHSVHYLRGGFAVAPREGCPLETVYAAPDVAAVRGRTLWVGVEDPAETITGRRKITPKQNWPLFRVDFARVLADRLRRTGIFGAVYAMDDPLPAESPELALKIAVTEWHEGNGLLRFLLGFGFGATRVQWEGALLDTRTDHVYFAFADARAHPGGPHVMGWGSAPVFQGAKLIAMDLNWASDDLVRTLQTLLGTPVKASGPTPR